MPLIDKPLEELQVYKGVSPRPHDFDEYWEAALRELSTASLAYTLTEAPIGTDTVACYDMYFTGVRGAKIHCKLAKPRKIEGKAKAVAMFHGYTGHAGDWLDKIAYAGAGFVVAAMDARGQGGYSEDISPVRGTTFKGHIIRGIDDPDPHNLLFRSIYLDTAQLARILMSMPFVDETRVGATGFSQGGALTIACASLEPNIHTAAVGYPFLCDYKRVWDMDLCKGAYEELGYYMRLYDPMHKNIDNMFERLGYIDLQYLAPRIRAKTRFFTGLMDTICPPSTQFAAYNKIKSEKSMDIYPDFGHEGLPGAGDTVFKMMLDM